MMNASRPLDHAPNGKLIEIFDEIDYDRVDGRSEDSCGTMNLMHNHTSNSGSSSLSSANNKREYHSEALPSSSGESSFNPLLSVRQVVQQQQLVAKQSKARKEEEFNENSLMLNGRKSGRMGQSSTSNDFQIPKRQTDNYDLKIGVSSTSSNKHSIEGSLPLINQIPLSANKKHHDDDYLE